MLAESRVWSLGAMVTFVGVIEMPISTTEMSHDADKRWFVTVIVVVPADSAVTVPYSLTVATCGAEDVQVRFIG